MSRLWIKTESDLRKGNGKGASSRASAQINWGSASNSKRAASIEVYWPKGRELPEVTVRVGEKANPIPEENTSIHAYSSIQDLCKSEPQESTEEFACAPV